MSLLEKTKNKTDSLQKNSNVPIPTGIKQLLSEASLYAFFQKIQSGELVVEAVLILPIFIITLLMMISFMGIYSLQTTKLTETCQNAKILGTYASISEEGAETVTLPNIYRYSFFYAVLPMKSLYMENHVTVRCWKGEKASASSSDDERMVYVTENGNVFHARDCSYLQPSVRTVLITELNTLRNQKGEIYSACRKCASQVDTGVVYITEDGNRYHCSRSCTSLSHVVIMMKYSEAIQSKRPCSRCGGGAG